jgi:putative ATPase
LTALEAASVAAGQASVDRAADDGDENPDARERGDDSDVADHPVPVITPEIVARAVDRALLRYDRNGDEHYDVISAFIKSVRGSDVDAALHYLARMIEAGEDPRFIARRIIVLASEDIGMADPAALGVAVAAADAVQYIGMPEGRIPLAQAVVHLATAPKSNAAYVGIDRAIADVREGRAGRVPKHLRDAHYPGAKRLGHGKGYTYPHDDPIGVVAQEYLPDELRGAVYYEPTEHGNEREVSARLAKLRRIVRGG